MAKDLLRETRDYFKAQNIPEIDATILLMHVLQCSRGEIPLKLLKMPQDELHEVDRELRRLVLRRQNSEPVQYIVGSAPFRYQVYQVGPGVLIPRPETESLVSLVIGYLSENPTANSVVDLGSGSGCIALSIATEVEGVQVTAVEKSPEALHWLKENSSRLAPDIRVIEADVVDALIGESFDVFVANPPYIPDHEFMTVVPAEVKKEPELALRGNSGDGMRVPMEFIATAARLLKTGGYCAIEHHETQAGLVAAAMSADFQEIKGLPDLNGRPRFTTAIRR
jgi:release factor glutamine methyltransferase